MKKIYLLAVGIIATAMSYAQVTITSTAGTPSSTVATLNDAFTKVNDGTHQGAITITIGANTTEPATPVRLLKSAAPSSYTSITIKPSGNVSVSSGATPTSQRAMIELYGADNVTIDGDDPATAGSRNLSFITAVPAATTTTAVLRLSSTATDGSDGVTNTTIKNCIIIGSRFSATSTTSTYGILFAGTSTTSLTGGSNGNTNITLENNDISRVYYGIYAAGSATATANTGLIIRNNVMGSTTAANNIGFRGVYISYATATAGTGAPIVEGNDIRVGDVTAGGTGYSSSIAGIEVASGNAGAIIRKNNVHDIYQPSTSGYGAFGISVTSGTENAGVIIVNNFIRDVVASKYSSSLVSTFENYGLYISGGATGLIINHNTIALQVTNSTGTVTNSTSAAITITASAATVAQLLNNIILNLNTSTQAFGIYTSATTNLSGGNINNNDYYIPNGSVAYYNAATQTTLAAFQTASGKDAASMSANPNFVSATDLHLTNAASQLESAGAPTATTGVTEDYDGQVRPGPVGGVNGGGSAPDIGADEFDGIKTDLTGPVISYTALNSDCSTGNRTISNVTITDATGVPTTGTLVPRIYYRKNGGAWYSQPGTFTGGSAINGQWSFTIQASQVGGVAMNDSLNYYIIAQDVAPTPNISSNPFGAVATDVNNVTTPPSSLRVIYVGGAMSGNYTVGTGGNYSNLAHAINIYNASACIAGPVTFTLTSANYASESLPIVINNPAATSGTMLTIRPGVTTTITGAAPSGAIFKIMGNYVTIDGSITAGGSTKDLTLTNTSATSPSVVLIGSTGTTPINNVTLKNTNVINGAQTASAIVVSDATTSGTAGYFNNINIQNNSVQKAYIGIYSIATVAPGNGSGLNISGNDLSTTGTNSIAFIGIYVQGVDGATVSKNLIGNFDPVSSQDDIGIFLATGTVNSLVERNNISNLGYTGTGGYGGHGIQVGTATLNANVRIANNMISNMTGDGYTYTGTPTDNPIGILLSSTTTLPQSGISIYYNSIRMEGNTLNQANSLSMGMYLTAGSTAAIVNNIIVNNLGISATSTATGQGSAGIVAATANTQFSTINYNDYYVAPTGTGTKEIGRIGATGYTTLAAWQAASGQDANSINVLPSFVGATDLHLTSAGNAAFHVGTRLPGYYDYDGDTRGAPNTDLGADEIINAVPVTMLDLKGARLNAINNLTWTTLTESNNRGFALERSSDGTAFTEITFVATKAANGNSSSALNYKYQDLTAAAGINYYRLRQVDVDGRATYSNVVSIQSGRVTTLTLNGIYPNPATSVLNLKLASPSTDNINLVITDLSGRVVMQKNAQVTAGDNNITMDVSTFSKGMYMLKATCAEGCESAAIKFEKQ